jgi:hypothetical protein
MNFRSAIAQQRAGQQPGFDQNLKSVADAEHQAAVGGELLHRAITGEKRAMAPQRR